MAPEGVLNFTTVHIPPGVVVSFVANNLNTPVFLAATGDILIEGTLVVSGRDYFATAGPGGGAAGLPIGLLGSAGGGPAGGQPGGQARGGAGGGYSSETVAWDPFRYSTGGNGGLGYFSIQANHLEIHPQAVIEAMANLNPKLGIGHDGSTSQGASSIR